MFQITACTVHRAAATAAVVAVMGRIGETYKNDVKFNFFFN